jgi:hypothetical protein
MLGEPSIRRDPVCRPERLAVLVNHLRRFYPASHPVVVYEAAQYPGCDPLLRRVPLSRLASVAIPPTATLYVKPLPSRVADVRVIDWLAQP